MSLLQTLLSPWRRLHAALLAPRMVYGWRGTDGVWRPHTRISTHAALQGREQLVLGDHVFIGHFNFLDAAGGLVLEDGVQVTNHCSLLTHSSHRTLRLEREAYWGHAAPLGLERAATRIGAWTFIGPHSVVAAGSRIGRGVLVKGYSLVRGEVPDFAIVAGQPARQVGDVRESDRAWLADPAHAGARSEAARQRYAAWLQDRPGAAR